MWFGAGNFQLFWVMTEMVLYLHHYHLYKLSMLKVDRCRKLHSSKMPARLIGDNLKPFFGISYIWVESLTHNSGIHQALLSSLGLALDSIISWLGVTNHWQKKATRRIQVLLWEQFSEIFCVIVNINITQHCNKKGKKWKWSVLPLLLLPTSGRPPFLLPVGTKGLTRDL